MTDRNHPNPEHHEPPAPSHPADPRPDPEHSGHHGGHGHHHEHGLVTITVNNHEFRIRPGRHSVAEIKTVGHVPLADDLEQIVDGNQLKLLPDEGHVEIHGCERFVSHPKSASSS